MPAGSRAGGELPAAAAPPRALRTWISRAALVEDLHRPFWLAFIG